MKCCKHPSRPNKRLVDLEPEERLEQLQVIDVDKEVAEGVRDLPDTLVALLLKPR